MNLSREKIASLFATEQQAYCAARPKSAQLAKRGAAHFLFGVPMHWMNDWGTPFPLAVERAVGATLVDRDAHEYADFCLGDTGAMFGHSPPPVAAAIAAQAAQGLTTMLPSADAVWVAEALTERFALPFWQYTLSATDANRFLIRWARAVTGRSKLLIFDGCYHGTVDDVFVDLINHQPQTRASLLGQVFDLREHTVVVPFNDLPALKQALAGGDIALMLAEPVMTNVGMVLPEENFWPQAAALLREQGTLLAMDETHTISTGVGGYCQAHALLPDALVLGKPIAGGLPCAVYGMSAHFAARAQQVKAAAPEGHSGIGTTLSANLLASAAMKANLQEVATEAAYVQMIALCQQLAEGLRQLIDRHQLPWCVIQIGARCEFQFCPQPPKNGQEAKAAFDAELEQVIHLYLLNRGVLITPFHNMMLVSPVTTSAQVAQLLAALDSCITTLT